MTLPRALVVIVGVAALWPACRRSDERAPALRPASGTERADSPATASAADALNEISATRCDRELRCGGLGPDATRDECIAGLNARERPGLDAQSCPTGVDQAALSRCLGEIDAERCDAPLDTLERLAACRSAVLCRG